ncbi:MAG TPA: hypothetical protein VGJ65_17995 [Albitalea sp.]|jgi:hypothetical protein
MLKPVLPWWRVPMVWLVIAGPAVVVAASIATFVIALRGGDSPVREAAAPQAETMTPATLARNHAAAARR